MRVIGFLLLALLCYLAGNALVQSGATAERARWQARENLELRSAQDKILTLTQDAQRQERGHAVRMAALETQLLQERKRASAQHQADLDRLRAGALRLRDPGARPTACSPGAEPAGRAATASATSGDGAAGGELSSAAAEFLLGLAAEADDVVAQLSAAQHQLIEDRRLCGTPDHE